MTIKEYITSKFSPFGINISDADLLDMLNDTDYTSNDSCDGDALNVANIAMTKFIPSLLLRATSISESGFSMSWNINGIKEYYTILCSRYGLDNELPGRPTIEFL